MKIDSHQHFWKYNDSDYVWMVDKYAYCRRDFLPDDLAPLLAAGQLDGSIAVQARQFLKETDFLLELAEANSFIKGVVGWIPLRDASVERHLEKYAGHEKIVGFRHVVHDEADDQFILRSDFNAGIKALSRYALCYDVLIFERHLPQTITFVDQHPGLRMVVDHIAKPRIRRNSFDRAWGANIKRLAQRENVTCKLSGIVTEVDDDTWDEALLKPYFETVLEAFGPKRLMFGSDWPVCLMRSTHTKWVETVRSFIAPLCEACGKEAAERFLAQLTPEARELIALHGPRAAALFRELGEQATPLLRELDTDLLRVFESQGRQTAARRSWMGFLQTAALLHRPRESIVAVRSGGKLPGQDCCVV